MSSELRKDQDLQEAHLVAKKLVESGWSDPERSSPYHAGLLLQNYYLPLIWLGETEQVVEDTHNWKAQGVVRGALGTIRAMAFRQSVESERDGEHIQNTYCQAIEVLDEVFNLDGYARAQVTEGMKLVEQLAYLRRGNQALSEKSKINYTHFVDKHLFTLAQQHNTYTLDNPEVIRWIQKMSTLDIEDGNPFLSDRWQRLVRIPESKSNLRISEDIEEGWIRVIIDRRPRHHDTGDYKPFLFAQDVSQKEYFVSQNTLESDAQIWNDIQPGDHLEILPEPYPPEMGKYPRATASRLVE